MNITKENNNNRILLAKFRLQQLAMKWMYTVLRKPIAILLVYSGLIARLCGIRNTGLKLILKGRRVDYVGIVKPVLQNIIEKYQDGGYSEFNNIISDNYGHPASYYDVRMLVMKVPELDGRNLIEKGALIIKFSETFIPLYSTLDLELLTKYFHIILEPSSSGYCAEEILIWTTIDPAKILVLTPDEMDYDFITELNTNLIPVKVGAADWVNPKTFYKVANLEKEYDAIYVANFNPVKRVDRYIKAIERINKTRKNYHAALVCAGFGSARNEILTMIEQVKDKANISYFDGMSQSELNMVFNRSKVNILLSLKEGANKGLAEGMFAETPAILLEENIGVKRTSINEKTGRIIPDAKLEETLIWFSDNYEKYQPEIWARNNISPVVSAKILGDVIEKQERAEGREWKTGLFAKVNEPELAYLDQQNAWLLDKRKELLSRFEKPANEEAVISFLNELKSDAGNKGV